MGILVKVLGMRNFINFVVLLVIGTLKHLHIKNYKQTLGQKPCKNIKYNETNNNTTTKHYRQHTTIDHHKHYTLTLPIKIIENITNKRKPLTNKTSSMKIN